MANRAIKENRKVRNRPKYKWRVDIDIVALQMAGEWERCEQWSVNKVKKSD